MPALPPLRPYAPATSPDTAGSFSKVPRGAHILDAAAIDYHDLIRAGDGAEAVGDDQYGLSRHQLAHGLLDHGLVLGVYVGSRLVQHHNGRVLEHGPGDGDALTLASGQMGAASAHHRVIAVFQTADKASHPAAFATASTSRGGRRAAMRMFSRMLSSKR